MSATTDPGTSIEHVATQVIRHETVHADGRTAHLVGAMRAERGKHIGPRADQ